MRLVSILLIGFLLVTTLACSGAQKKAYKAQEAVHKERLRLVEEYKKCLKKAGDDTEKTEACDSYLRSAEALK